MIGQRKVERKRNEITAIPELLKLLDVHGCIITMDAIGTQKEIAKQIRAQKADYVLAVKGNQGVLHDRISSMFADDRKEEFKKSPFEHARTVNKGHGRIEIRHCWVTDDPESVRYADPEQKWDGLRSIAIVENIRRTNAGETKELRYFLSSLEPEAEKMLSHIRAHRGVENKLHRMLDVVFREDDNRVRKGSAQENIAIMRKIALNVLRKEKTKKCGAKTKR